MNLEKLIETLALCEQSLPPDSHPTHYTRLRLIKQILERDGEEIQDAVAPVDLPTPTFTWIEHNSEYRAVTAHGTAVIVESQNNPAFSYTFGRAFTYTPRLEHPSGVVIHGYETRQFEAAETWIATRISELDHPTGDELDLDNLIFTLDLCAKVLPPKTKASHYKRLDEINMTISDILL